MHQTVTAPVAAPPDRVADIVGDLATYPDWLQLVTAAELAAGAESDEALPAWLVTIRAKVGPFARSKKLRMVRTVDQRSDDQSFTDAESPHRFRFERQELDGRRHSSWTLEAVVRGVDGDGVARSSVTMDLRYDGALWTAPLEPILGSFIADAGPSLERYANRSATA